MKLNEASRPSPWRPRRFDLVTAYTSDYARRGVCATTDAQSRPAAGEACFTAKDFANLHCALSPESMHVPRAEAGGCASATTDSKVWFTVAKGIVSETFYPRLDVPNMQDMQYVITDGSTFVDLERDATSHAVSMSTEKALEYTVTNTDTRPSARYRITSTYITDPSRNTLLIRTRFQSLDGGVYRLYLLANPSMAGGGAQQHCLVGWRRIPRSWQAGRKLSLARP